MNGPPPARDHDATRLSLLSPNALLVPLAYGAGLVLIAIFVTAYLGETWNNAISFIIPDGWCNTAAGEGVGAHCFGDFGLAFGHSGNPYVAGEPSATNSPLTMTLFRALALLPYNAALLIYELAILAGSIGVIVWGTKESGQLARAVAISLIGVGSLGILVALDRGNHVALLLPLALWYIVSLERKRWTQAVIALALIASLKFWGILLIVGLLAKRQYLRAAAAVGATAALVILPLALFPGGISSSLSKMIAAAGDHNYAAAISPYSVSIATLGRRVNCLVSDRAPCDFSAIQLGAPPQIGLTLGVTALILLAAFICLRFSTLQVIAYAPLACIGVIAVPEGPAYQCAFAVLVAALFMRFVVADRDVLEAPDFQRARAAKAAYLSLVVALVASIVPLPVWQFHAAGAFTSSFGDVHTFRLANWAVPVTWSVFLAVATWLTITVQLDRRKGNVEPSAGEAYTTGDNRT